MKRIILPFIILIFSSYGATADVLLKMGEQRPDTLKVKESLDIFRDVTDISRQIERRRAVRPVDVSRVEGILLKNAANDTVIQYMNPLDSLYSRNENGILQLPEYQINIESMQGFTLRDTLFYNPLFLPMIFTGKILPRKLSLYPLEEDTDKGLLIPQEKTFASQLEHIDFVRDVRREYYIKYPDRIRYSMASFDALPRNEVSDRTVRESFNPFRELIKAETAYSLETPGVEKIEIGRKYWVRSGEHSFQFAQNYFSENWHKGGTNNLNFNSYHVLRANYRKDKIKFNNTLEWRLSVFNAPDDTIRKYRIGNDLIRYYGDFGIDAFGKGWSYSTNLEAKSQLFKAYPVNSNDLRSSFLSPLYVNMGVGLKYSLNRPSSKVRHRNFKLDLSIAPISANATYVLNDSVDVSRFGIEDGKNLLIDIGSTITATVKYNFTKYITWDSNLQYFTSYEKVIMGFENTLDLALSNAFSTKIYVNLRFDDGVPPDPNYKYWQLSNTLSFGLSYKW